jgi:HSP20 family protein
VERSYGKYVRSFRLPEEVESEKIDAQFKNGVLTVHLPKGEKAKAHGKLIAVH